MHLLRELSYLPLAVAQAAACMNATSMAVQQYQAQLAEHKQAALEYTDDSSKGELRESNLRNTVAATLSLSTSQVRHSNAVAADYLLLAACIDRKDILLDLLAASPRARKEAIKVLERYALVTRRPAESALDVHRLVHHALRKRLQVQGRLQEWIQRTITQLLRVFPDNDHSNRSKWRRLLPHAQYVLSHSQSDDVRERLDLAWKCAMSLYSDGLYKGVLGNEHPDTLSSMQNLAFTLLLQARHEEAFALMERCSQLREQVLGEQHPNTQSSLDTLSDWHLVLARIWCTDKVSAPWWLRGVGPLESLHDHGPTLKASLRSS